ncbi:NAD(P)H-quinone oxidoreductase [Pseudochelatococcus contaminans]|uniref:NADPH2:quinone reductase n=1 Tax=Pseudochelatococcus contaminans TaxID=1538103 RepID=A0A7W6EFY8_9HYPH|nr:NAD(P)H-quinone oxidoreductase [Pseudochelatococcus contaminans]MBB3809075.1 NADPH2:quinone reductase [Pseudochelatococcus contaminans]
MASFPEEQTVIGISAPGGPEVLVPERRPVPRPGPGEVLVRVRAAGVNRPDVVQRQGRYPAPPGASDIPGLEVAGEVVAVGEGVTQPALGAHVTALVTGGGYAQYCIADAALALPIPDGLDFVAAAAIPETVFTVWSNVFDRGRLAAGETLLVHGGTSGIGTTAIQLGKAFGARVLTTAGSPEKCAACLRLGADLAIDYREQDFVAAVKEATDGRGANVILDMVGGDYIARNYQAAAQDGRIVQIAFLKGAKVEIDFTRLMLKRFTHTGSTLRSRPLAEKVVIAEALREKVWPLLSTGRCLPVIHTVLPLEEAAAAHELMESSGHIGKIVLAVN